MVQGSGQTGKERATIIYDASCPVCSSTVRWIGENGREGAFTMMPCQSLKPASEFPGITQAACMWAMQLVLPDGSVLAGEKALPEIFSRLRRYRFVSLLLRLPGAALMSRIAYRWFADRRYRIAAFFTHFTGGRKEGIDA